MTSPWRAVGAVVALLALCGGSPPKILAPALSPEAHLKHPGATPALGPPPPINAADYAPYLESGDSVVQGQAVVEFTNGKYLPCVGGCQIYLMPDTPYVRWRLIAWARMVDGNAAYDNQWWGGNALPPLPPYLRLNGKGTAIRAAQIGSDAYGDYRIAGVPRGRYILVFHAYQESTARGMTSPEYYEYHETPEHIAIGTVPGHETTEFITGEGYLVRSNSVTVDADVCTIPVNALVTIAHLYGG
jgi:hypothetical protein